MRARRFDSKIDGWIAAVTIVAAVITMIVAVGALWVASTGVMVVVWLVAVATAALPLWVLASTYYVVTASELLVRSGPFGWRVPLQQIRSVTPTRSVLSSPALSLDRLRIDYGDRRWLMVSPREREAFIAALRRTD